MPRRPPAESGADPVRRPAPRAPVARGGAVAGDAGAGGSTTRTRLLDVASALLEALGPTRTHLLTTRAVCEAAGVSAPTLYHHFGDKDGLVRAVVARAAAAFLAGKRALAPTADPVEDLRTGWAHWTAFIVAHPALTALAMELPPAAPAAARAPRDARSPRARLAPAEQDGGAPAAIAAAEALLAVRVAAVATAGRLRVPDAVAHATVRAAIDGVMTLVRRGAPGDEVRAVSALLCTAVLDAIATPPPSSR